jgi:hypothetical protein
MRKYLIVTCLALIALFVRDDVTAEERKQLKARAATFLALGYQAMSATPVAGAGGLLILLQKEKSAVVCFVQPNPGGSTSFKLPWLPDTIATVGLVTGEDCYAIN